MYKVKNKQFNQWDKVEIEWIDSFKQGGGWVSPKIDWDRAKKDMYYRTIGYLVYADKEMVAVTMSFQEVKDDIEAPLMIPVCAIQKVNKLKEGK